MTKEQIIGALKAAAKPYEEYYIDDEVVDAINTYSNPYELVAPILEIIADNPSVDFGMPGELVHFVEQFYKNGYEELLIASVSENQPRTISGCFIGVTMILIIHSVISLQKLLEN